MELEYLMSTAVKIVRTRGRTCSFIQKFPFLGFWMTVITAKSSMVNGKFGLLMYINLCLDVPNASNTKAQRQTMPYDTTQR